MSVVEGLQRFYNFSTLLSWFVVESEDLFELQFRLVFEEGDEVLVFWEHLVVCVDVCGEGVDLDEDLLVC